MGGGTKIGKVVLVVGMHLAAVLVWHLCAVPTAGPARMADTFEVAVPYPRILDIKTQPEFGVYSRRIYQLLGMK